MSGETNNCEHSAVASGFDMEEIKRFITKAVESACKSTISEILLSQNLENTIQQEAIHFESQENGDTIMAAKFKERVMVGFDEQGKPIERWATGSTRDELQFNITQLLIESGRFDMSTQPKQEADTSPNWEVYAKDWLEVFHKSKVREKTWVKDKGIMTKHVLPMFAGMPIGSITPVDIQVQLNARAGLSKSYIRDIMHLTNQIFDSAVDDDIIQKNPMDSKKVFNPSKRPPKERRALTKEEQADIIEHIPNLSNETDKMFVAFLMYTGMRPGEIYGLTWEHIDFDQHIIRVTQALAFVNGKGVLGAPKTESGIRIIPMGERLESYLLPNRGSGFVFKPSRGGSEHYTEQAAKRTWQRICKTIDMHGMIPYEARHTYATNLSRNGVPMKTAMLLMGHKDERPLNRNYIHVDESDIMAAGEKINTYLGDLGV